LPTAIFAICHFMIPILLDLLTVFFIIAGLILLWLNMRERRRSKVIVTPDERDGARSD
jgi:hypothetical protein